MDERDELRTNGWKVIDRDTWDGMRCETWQHPTTGETKIIFVNC